MITAVIQTVWKKTVFIPLSYSRYADFYIFFPVICPKFSDLMCLSYLCVYSYSSYIFHVPNRASVHSSLSLHALHQSCLCKWFFFFLVFLDYFLVLHWFYGVCVHLFMFGGLVFAEGDSLRMKMTLKVVYHRLHTCNFVIKVESQNFVCWLLDKAFIIFGCKGVEKKKKTVCYCRVKVKNYDSCGLKEANREEIKSFSL